MKSKRYIKIGSVFLLIVTLILSTVTMAFAAEKTDKWEIMSSMSDKRACPQVIVLNGKIYAIGGMDGNNNITSSVEVYDPSAKGWSPVAPMKTPRCGPEVVALSGKIYAIGGFQINGVSTSSVEEYDPVKNVWTPKTSMKTARGDFKAQVINGKIFVIGGSEKQSSGLSSTELYDPEKDTWEDKASMSVARHDFEELYMDGKIYVMGGANNQNQLSSAEEYDPSSDTWKPLSSMKSARTDFQATAINGKIYALGGWDGGKSLSSVETYDMSENQWSYVASMKTARNDFQSVTCDNKIYVTGGTCSGLAGGLSAVEVFDPIKGYWESLSSMNFGRFLCGSIILNHRIYAIGGYGTGGRLSSVESYDLGNSGPTLTVTASPNKVKVGQQFTTDIAIHNETNICAEDIKVAYDKDLFEYEGATGQTGTKIYKEDASTPGTIRFITACQGKDNAATGDKGLITLKFKAKAKGVGKVDIIKGHIADNATLEEDVADENCGEDTIAVDGYADVNRSGSWTLLDLGIDAYYDGVNASDTDSTKYDADVIPDGKIDSNDLTQITQEILANKDYAPNNY